MKTADEKQGLDSDFVRFLALKANDLEIAATDRKLIEHCWTAFHCIHCAGLAFVAVGLSAEPRGRFWFVVDNCIQWLRGLPGLPMPDGDPLDAVKALSPVLELLVERCTKDLDIRRVLHRLVIDDCGCLPAGSWSERTSHAAAVRFAEGVLNDMWLAVIGIAGTAEARKKDVPRFDESRILQRHRGVIRRSLKKYQSIEPLGLLRGINDEVTRALTGKSRKQSATVLYLAADPSAVKPSDHLRLDEEVRAIEAEIRAGTNRDELDLRSAWAVQAPDLSRELLYRAPSVVHFGCHGDFVNLELEAENSEPHAITHQAVSELFRTFKDVRLVFLNVCNSAPLARELVKHVDCAIGMEAPIADDSAVLFARAAYRALASGRSVQEAFDLGKAELALHDRPDVEVPTLASKKGCDPSSLFLTGPNAQTVV